MKTITITLSAEDANFVAREIYAASEKYKREIAKLKASGGWTGSRNSEARTKRLEIIRYNAEVLDQIAQCFKTGDQDHVDD